MAEVDTAMLGQQHSDIRREQAEQTSTIRRESADRFGEIRYDIGQGVNEIVKEGLKESFEARGDTKDARYDLASRIENAADRITGLDTQYYIAGQANAVEAARDLASLKVLTDANATAMRHELALNIERVGAASALQAEKIASAVALGQSLLSKEISHDGQKTRELINDLKYHDLNRALVERNAELVEERESRRHWRGVADQNQFGAQFAQLQSMMQNFNSQLADTRQGMVNFGTMAGVGQTSTSNNVR